MFWRRQRFFSLRMRSFSASPLALIVCKNSLAAPCHYLFLMFFLDHPSDECKCNLCFRWRGGKRSVIVPTLSERQRQYFSMFTASTSFPTPRFVTAQDRDKSGNVPVHDLQLQQ